MNIEEMPSSAENRDFRPSEDCNIAAAKIAADSTKYRTVGRMGVRNASKKKVLPHGVINLSSASIFKRACSRYSRVCAWLGLSASALSHSRMALS